MAKHKNRKIKAEEYKIKYEGIPLDYKERLSYLYDKLNLNFTKGMEIMQTRNEMLSSLYYREFKIILYEEPEGTPRPRFRLINRKNIGQAAFNNGQFVHVYSLNAKDDHMYMERIIGDGLAQLDQFIYTPCELYIEAFMKTPSAFNNKDTYLAEMGLIRPITKPDWDNIGKKYSDMFNSNLWLDDTLVVDGTIRKFYSILPRVEITIRYLNMLHNKYQYKSVNNKIDGEINYFGGDQKC